MAFDDHQGGGDRFPIFLFIFYRICMYGISESGSASYKITEFQLGEITTLNILFVQLWLLKTAHTNRKKLCGSQKLGERPTSEGPTVCSI